MQETSEMQVQSLGQDDPLEEGILAGECHGQRSLAGCSPWGHKELDTTEPLSMHTCMMGKKRGENRIISFSMEVGDYISTRPCRLGLKKCEGYCQESL